MSSSFTTKPSGVDRAERTGNTFLLAVRNKLAGKEPLPQPKQKPRPIAGGSVAIDNATQA